MRRIEITRGNLICVPACWTMFAFGDWRYVWSRRVQRWMRHSRVTWAGR